MIFRNYSAASENVIQAPCGSLFLFSENGNGPAAEESTTGPKGRADSVAQLSGGTLTAVPDHSSHISDSCRNADNIGRALTRLKSVPFRRSFTRPRNGKLFNGGYLWNSCPCPITNSVIENIRIVEKFVTGR